MKEDSVIVVDSFDNLKATLISDDGQFVYEDPLNEFKKAFNNSDFAALVTMKYWSRDSDEPFVTFNPCGVFSSLDQLAKAIFRSIHSHYTEDDITRIPVPTIECFDKELHIDFEAKFQFEIGLIPLNSIDLDVSGNCDWKFDLLKDEK